MSLLPRLEQLQRRRAVLLALLAGYVDGYSLRAYNVYVSFMSGNTTQAGTLFGHERYLAALPFLLAILFFVIGSIAGTWTARSKSRHARRTLLAAIAVLFAAVIADSQIGSAPFLSAGAISLLGAAMGMMNAVLSHIGMEPVSVTFVTGTLNKVGTHIALAIRRDPLADAQGEWDTHLRRAAVSASVWMGFVAGAIFVALAGASVGSWALVAPLCVIVMLMLEDLIRREPA